MRGLREFLKTTLVGGFLFIVPLALVVLLARATLKLISGWLQPLAEWLSAERVSRVVVADVLAIVVLVAVCFLAGLFVRTRLGQAISLRLERRILRRVPGYAFLKSVTHEVAGLETGPNVAAALARFDDAWVLALLMERHADGLCTVFVPGAPSPTSGAIHYMTEDRVKLLEVPVLSVMKCIMSLGIGSGELLAPHFRDLSSVDSPSPGATAPVPSGGPV